MMVSSFKLSILVLGILGWLSLATPIEKKSAEATGPDAVLAQKALDNAYKVLNSTLSDGSIHTGCTKDNLVVRKE